MPADPDALYLAIAEAIATDLSAGVLVPGDRLPPQRELADRLGVALGTVTRGYAEAERRGLVHGQGRRGTFVSDVARQRSGLRSLVDTSGLIDLSANHPAPSLDPDLAPPLKVLARRSDVGSLLSYPPSDGLPRHREAAARWLVAQGVPCAAEAVVMTAGAQHAIGVTLAAVTRPGDEIACEPLSYPGMKAAAGYLGLTLVAVPADPCGLDPDGFARLCRTRSIRLLYVIPTLQNPTSAILPAARKRAIVAIARRHDVLILEDEINRALTEHANEPFTGLAPERSFLVTSSSKALTAGLRVGCVVGPPAYRGALVESVMASLIGLSPLPAELFAIWIDDGSAARTIAARRKEARARQREARRLLGRSTATIRSHPDSSHLWLELPGRWPLRDFVRDARARGVAVAPADIFATGAQVPPAVRVALSAPPSRARMIEGLRAIADLLADVPRPRMATL